jgi:hypothetical protein
MAKSRSTRNQEHGSNRPNIWGMIDHIWTVAMNRGQAPVLGVILIILVLVIKLPSNDVSLIFRQIFHLLEMHHLLGWLLAVLELLVVPLILKVAGKTRLTELDRIGKRNAELEQEILQLKQK